MLLTLLLASSIANAPSVEEILERAIEVQRQHEEAGNEVKYNYELLSVTEKLDKNGDVKEVEKHLFESSHIENIAYERLVEKNGKSLTQKELKREAKRERNFRKKLAKGEAQHNDAEERVTFDEELIARYDFELDDVRDVFGRKTYIVSYRPKPGKLQEKSAWIACSIKPRALFGSTRRRSRSHASSSSSPSVSSSGGGMLGSISKMKGTFMRHPVSEDIDIWLPERANFYIQGRVLFRSLHVREKVFWSDFARRRQLKIAASPSSESPEKPR